MTPNVALGICLALLRVGYFVAIVLMLGYLFMWVQG